MEYSRQELLEVSAVPVPANPRTLAKALEGGLAVPRLRPLFTPGGGEEVCEDDAAEVIAGLRQLRASLA